MKFLRLWRSFSALLVAGCTPLTRYEEIASRLPEESLLRIGAQRVHVEQWGDRGPALVLLHGFGSSSYAFQSFGPLMARNRRVVAIDLNGFGFTERPRNPDAYSLAGQMQLVTAVMDDLGIRTADVLGHSYGGYLAMMLATEHPERVRRLALVSPALHMDGGSMGILKWPAVRWAVYPVVRLLLSDRERVHRLLVRSYHRQGVLTADVATAYQQRLAIEGLFRAYRGFGASMPSLSGDRVKLDDLVQPTLLVVGREDEVIPLTVFEKRVPDRGVTLRVLEDCGHSVPEEQPRRLAEVIESFLDS